MSNKLGKPFNGASQAAVVKKKKKNSLANGGNARDMGQKDVLE